MFEEERNTRASKMRKDRKLTLHTCGKCEKRKKRKKKKEVHRDKCVNWREGASMACAFTPIYSTNVQKHGSTDRLKVNFGNILN